MHLLGIHHITFVCSNARRTVDFYTRILGFRLVKKTVNFDDPGAYHLYFGNETASPGTLLTFFEWKDLTRGQRGFGTTHHSALMVDSDETQLKWKRWLQDHGVEVTGPYNRGYFKSILFADPDGALLEIVTHGPGWTVDEPEESIGTTFISPPELALPDHRDERAIAAAGWPDPVREIAPGMELKGIHHITAISSDLDATTAFYTEVLGLRVVKKTANYDDPSTPQYYFGLDDGAPGSIVSYFGYTHEKMQQGRIGTGMTHHFAFGVQDDDEQIAWRERLLSSGIEVTPVKDRRYFRSIYFWDPDGQMVEISTAGPGFAVDEDAGSLGKRLCLPPWLEPDRMSIESSLMPLDAS